MIKPSLTIVGQDIGQDVSNRLTSVLEPESAQVFGHEVPRIHTPLNDLPSRGHELIDFADQIIEGGFMPWQKWLAVQSLKVKPDGR